MKRTAAEMEGAVDENDDVEEDEEGEAEDDDDEVPREKEGRMLQPQRQQEEAEDGEEDDIGEGEDNLEEDMEYQQPSLGIPNATNKRPRREASDDDNEKGAPSSAAAGAQSIKGKDDDDDDEENLDVDYDKAIAVDKERIQLIMSEFTKDQMSRYECYRRSNFPKANMKRLLQSVAGCSISMPMTIVMSGIAKMFVGELVETARRVMTERKETGPTRPCHIREAYRRLKLKGKVPLSSRPRLFR